MSAEQFGASLLADVELSSLDSILKEVRHAISPQNEHLFGIPQLDRLLEALPRANLEPRNYRASESSSRTVTVQGNVSYRENEQYDVRTTQAFSTSSSTFRSLPIVEITSNASSNGKTSLLHLVTCTAILPALYGGRGGSVIWIDSINGFEAGRQHAVCTNHLSHTNPDLSPAAWDTISREALRHVHVMSCSSSTNMLSLLNNTTSYLLQRQSNPHLNDDSSSGGITSTTTTTTLPRHFSSHRALSLIVVDGINAFYWPDRFATELLRLESPAAQREEINAKTAWAMASQMLDHLKVLQNKFGCNVVYTTLPSQKSPSIAGHAAATAGGGIATSHYHQAARQPPPPPATTTRQPILPSDQPRTTNVTSQWTSSATLSLTLTRIPVPQFASHMTIDECLRDRHRRSEVVQDARFRVTVNDTSSDRVASRDRATAETRDRTAQMRRKTGFTLHVNDQGVSISD